MFTLKQSLILTILFVGLVLYPGCSSAQVSPTPVLSPSQAQVTSTTASVNLRTGPGQENAVIQALATGTVVTLLYTNDDGSWYRVRLDDGTEGWIAAFLLTLPPSTEAQIAALISEGDSFFEVGNFAGAVESYTQALVLDANSIRAYRSRGNANQNLGNFEQAVADYDAALALDLIILISTTTAASPTRT